MEKTQRFSSFILSIDRISKNIKRIKDNAMKKYDLRSAHVMCLFNLVKSQDGLNSTELAEACGVDKAFISRVTGELERRGYIKRNQNARSSIYKCKFVLTEAGFEINQYINQKIAEIMTEVSGTIADHKLKIFYEVLGIIDENISFELKEEKYGK
ncbi:MAG: MarR family transcriptional regulator [Clostridia bacterium]|nr:MarR family transcriptional regulator [Clostridia bacterium]